MGVQKRQKGTRIRSAFRRRLRLIKNAFRKAKTKMLTPIVCMLIGASPFFGATAHAKTYTNLGLGGNATVVETGSQIGPTANFKIKITEGKMSNRKSRHMIVVNPYVGIGGINYLDAMYLYGTVGLEGKYRLWITGKDKLVLKTKAAFIPTNFYDHWYLLSSGYLKFKHIFNKDYWLNVGTGGYAGISFPNYALRDIRFWTGMGARMKYINIAAIVFWRLAANSPIESIYWEYYKPWLDEILVLIRNKPQYLSGFVISAQYSWNKLSGHEIGGGLGYTFTSGPVVFNVSGYSGVIIPGDPVVGNRPIPFISANLGIRRVSTKRVGGSPVNKPSVEINSNYSRMDIGKSPSVETDRMSVYPNLQTEEQKEIYKKLVSMISENKTLDSFVGAFKDTNNTIEDKIKMAAMFAELLEAKGYAYETLNDLLHGRFNSDAVKKIASASIEKIYEEIRNLIINGSTGEIAVCGGIHMLVAHVLAMSGLRTYTFVNNSRYGAHIATIALGNKGEYYVINYGQIIKAEGAGSIYRVIEAYARDQGAPQFQSQIFDGKTGRYLGTLKMPEMNVILGAGGMEDDEIQALRALMGAP